MFFIIRLLLLIVIVFLPSIRAMEKKDQIEKDQADIYDTTRTNSTNYKGLLIFLDESELEIKKDSVSTIKAASKNLFAAMHQKPSCPIVASASLLKTIFWAWKKKKFSQYEDSQENDEEYYQLHEEALIEFYQDNENKKKIPGKYAVEQIKNDRFLYLKASKINPNEWTIKEITTDLYLLLSIKYLNEAKINEIDFIDNIADNKVTKTELALGLKCNHMKTTTIENILQQPKTNYKKADYFITALFEEEEKDVININKTIRKIKTTKSKLFCSLSDYLSYNRKQQEKKQLIEEPVWSIFMNGHGELRLSIVGITLKDFDQFLSILKIRFINTRLLLYRSCYAAGINAEKIYKSEASLMQKIYPFTIIALGLNDTATSGNKTCIQSRDNKLEFYTEAKYSNFINIINEKQYKEHNRIRDAIETFFSKALQLQNKPQIKKAGFEFFIPYVSNNKKIISIGSILAKTHSPDTPFRIKDDAIVVLLYAREIPFEIIINPSPSFLGIASMTVGYAIHIIKKIKAENTKYENILEWFMKIKSLGVGKYFFIEKINSSNGTLRNVIIEYNNQKCSACYMKKKYPKNLFVYEKNSINNEYLEKSIDSKDPAYTTYINNKRIVHYEAQNTDDHDKLMKYIPTITSPYIINRITTWGLGTFLSLASDFIEKIQSTNAYFLIRELVAKNDFSTMNMTGIENLPNEKTHPLIIVNNVVVLPRPSNNGFSPHYITYNNEFYYFDGNMEHEYKKIEDNYMEKYNIPILN
jgi:hypothetical protein